MGEMNEDTVEKKTVWVDYEYTCFFLYAHFIGRASVTASGGGLFRHLLHLTLLAAVVIFLLNDA